jgi:hypothetical protein
MQEKTYTISNLSKEDLKLILEALLYTSSVDVTGNYDSKFGENFYKIAYNIRKNYPEVIVENLEILNHENIPFSDLVTTDILRTFPETSVENFNII